MNAVGGQDELVFDGGSMVMAPDGTVAHRAKMFDEDLLIVNISEGVATHGGARARPVARRPRGAYRALVAGTARLRRQERLPEVVLGLSGGIDSASSRPWRPTRWARGGARARDAFGYSSSGERGGRGGVRSPLGIRIDTIPINEVFDRYRFSLAQLFAGTKEDVAEENLQARVRGNLLMALSNKFGSIVLATGNKSEYAVGYSTLYGDMAGGFAPIKDVPKTLVYELASWRNAQPGGGAPIPERTIDKPPSAELRPDQKDTDSLPPYDELDPVIEAYVEDDLGVDEMVASGVDRDLVERVVRMIDHAEYKRRQAAPGVKITPKAFGRDRRMPITNRYPN